MVCVNWGVWWIVELCLFWQRNIVDVIEVWGIYFNMMFCLLQRVEAVSCMDYRAMWVPFEL